jgi:hypothetical protein
VGLLLGLLVIGAGSASAQPVAEPEPAFNVRVYPLDVWNPRAGWGIGVGAVAHHLGRPGSQVLVTAAPAVHESVGTLSIASAHPSVVDTYVVLDARVATTDRQWFYGLGPRSREANLVAVDLTSWWARLRVGHRLGASPVTVQPHLSLLTHDVNGSRNVSPRALSRLDGASIDAIPGAFSPVVDPLPGSAPALPALQRGVRAGLDLIVDTRDRRYGATRGLLVQATGSFYNEMRDADLRFARLDLRAHGFVPLGGRHRLALGARTAVTHNGGDAPVPFFLLPNLDGRTVPGWARDRFVGADLVSLRALYRFPLVQFRDLLTVEGHLGVHAASVYDDLGEQFAFDLSFDERIGASSTVPLRPAASTGLRLGPLFRDETYVDVALGLSPEGVTGVRFTFVQSLRSLRPAHHRSPE